MKFTNTISSLVQICRPVNVLITFASIVVAAVICIEGDYSIFRIALAGISGALIAAGGNVINDIYDLKIDKINKPGRVLPSGKLTKNGAFIYYLLLTVTGLSLSASINPAAFFIALSAVVLLFAYSFRLKKIPLAGNIIIAVITGLAFIYGGISVNNALYALIPFFFAFTINLIREIIKDMEDVSGDSAECVMTFPLRYGFRKSKNLVLIFSLILILSTFYPFVTGFYKIYYFVVVMILVNPIMIYMLRSVYKDDSTRNLNKLSIILKLNMIFGLTAIYLGK